MLALKWYGETETGPGGKHPRARHFLIRSGTSHQPPCPLTKAQALLFRVFSIPVKPSPGL